MGFSEGAIGGIVGSSLWVLEGGGSIEGLMGVNKEVSSGLNTNGNSLKTIQFTPPRTPRISGLRSQILKPTFLS